MPKICNGNKDSISGATKVMQYLFFTREICTIYVQFSRVTSCQISFDFMNPRDKN